MTVGGFSIPGLTSRQSETTVRLADGQSFAIAGLLSDRVRSNDPARCRSSATCRSWALLFRSVSYQRDEIRAPGGRDRAPGQAGRAARGAPLPTDNELNDPNDIQLFLFGSDGRRQPGRAARYNEARRARCRDRRRSGRSKDRGAGRSDSSAETRELTDAKPMQGERDDV